MAGEAVKKSGASALLKSLRVDGVHTHAGGMNLRTIVVIRWIATAGQLAAILIVVHALGFSVPLYECMGAILALALSNLFVATRRNLRRLSDFYAALILAFDLLQLSVLFFLTGGLENPFSMLMLVPVTVSASILSRRITLALTLLALGCATFISFYHYPLPWPGGGIDMPLIYVLGIWTALAVSLVFMASFIWSASEESRRVAQALAASESALARAQQMAALGGLAAAAAHELGSPLATIAVVSKELSDEVPADSPLAEDIALLQSQSERCRDILASLTGSPGSAGIDAFGRAHLTAVIEEAASGYIPEDIAFEMKVSESASGPEPTLPRAPEILQGLGNIIQNAGQFARARVTITLDWDDDAVSVIVADDGPGFPAFILDNLGEPYFSTRAGVGGHLGLGIFIAHTLLERTGAALDFRNAEGAEVALCWPRTILEPS